MKLSLVNGFVCKGDKIALLLLVSFFLLLLEHRPATAQGSQPARFELIHEHGDHGFTAVSLKQNGLGLIREKEKTEGTQRLWEVILLDSALQQTWSTIVSLESRQTL